MSTAHIYSDITGDWRPSSGYDATEHAGGRTGHTYIGVQSVEVLVQAFRRFLGARTILEVMDFHTHGSGGAIYIGSQRLTPFENLDRFRGQHFENIFQTGAMIEFLGCNVAESPEGELFLAELGSIFLKNGGGQVKASTGAGVADKLYTGNVYHPTGRWVTARVRVGGGVSLNNHRHLLPQPIRDEIQRVQDRIRQMEQGTLSAATRNAIGRSREVLRLASDSIGPASSHPSYLNIYWARSYLAAAVGELRGSMIR